MSNFDELKRLAEAASKGPWHQGGLSGGARDPHWMREVRCMRSGFPCGIAFFGSASEKQAHFDAAYSAAANPAAILELLTQRGELLAALKGYVTAIATAGGGDKALFMAAIREADSAARAAIANATKGTA